MTKNIGPPTNPVSLAAHILKIHPKIHFKNSGIQKSWSRSTSRPNRLVPGPRFAFP